MGLLERSWVVVPQPPSETDGGLRGWGGGRSLCPGCGPQPCLAGPPAGRMPCGLQPHPAEGAKASVTSFFHCCPSLITWNEWPFVHERKATCMGL